MVLSAFKVQQVLAVEVACEVLCVALADVRPVSCCGTSLATHKKAQFRKPSLSRGWRGGWRRGRSAGNSTGSSGRLAGYEGGWQSLSGSHVSANRSVQAAGCEGLPGSQTILQAAQHKGAAVWILKVTFVLAAFLVHRVGKAKDLRLLLGGSCFSLKACSCLRTACFCFALFLFFSSGGSFNSL